MAAPTLRSAQTQTPELLTIQDVTSGPELASGWHWALAEAPSLGAALLQRPDTQVPGPDWCWHSQLWGLCPRKPGGQDEAFVTSRDPVARHPQILPWGNPRALRPLGRVGPSDPNSGVRQGMWLLSSSRPGLEPLPPSFLTVDLGREDAERDGQSSAGLAGAAFWEGPGVRGVCLAPQVISAF